jgi:hypothetical protein
VYSPGPLLLSLSSPSQAKPDGLFILGLGAGSGGTTTAANGTGTDHRGETSRSHSDSDSPLQSRIVAPDQLEEFMRDLPVVALPGVGYDFNVRLKVRRALSKPLSMPQ